MAWPESQIAQDRRSAVDPPASPTPELVLGSRDFALFGAVDPPASLTPELVLVSRDLALFGAVDPPASLTPELVLVSPDLGPAARALLPDRPWETHLAPATSRTSFARAHEPEHPPLGPEAPTSAPRSGSVWVKALVAAHAVAFVAFVTLVVVGSALPPRAAPTLEPGPIARASSAARREPATAAGSRSAPTVKRTMLAPSPAMRFQTSRGGASIARFEGTLRCAGFVTLPNITVSRKGTFQLTRKLWLGRIPVTVSLAGKTDPTRAVHGTIRVRRAQCDTGPVAFALRATSG